MIQLEAARGCRRSLICRIKILQDGLHFCTSHVPQLRYLRYIQTLYLILRYIIQSTNENAVLQKSFISQSELHYVQYAGLEIFQEQAHFSASSVPHLRHLRHVPVKCLILRHLFKSVNENAVLKIVQDGLHFGSSQAAHLSCLSCCIEKQLILSCLYFY